MTTELRPFREQAFENKPANDHKYVVNQLLTYRSQNYNNFYNFSYMVQDNFILWNPPLSAHLHVFSFTQNAISSEIFREKSPEIGPIFVHKKCQHIENKRLYY